MVHKETYLTGEGLAKLETELEHLRSVSRQEVAQRIQQAKELGGTVDNAEYEVAKNEQAFIEGRILTLENMIKNAVLIPDDRKPSGKVEVGSEVTIKDSAGKEHTYTIVGSSEADPSRAESPTNHPWARLYWDAKKGSRPRCRPLQALSNTLSSRSLNLGWQALGRWCILHQAAGFSE